MTWRAVRVAVSVICSLLLLVVFSVDKPPFIYSLVDGYLGSFQCFPIITKTTVNIYEQVYLWTDKYVVYILSKWSQPKNGAAE